MHGSEKKSNHRQNIFLTLIAKLSGFRHLLGSFSENMSIGKCICRKICPSENLTVGKCSCRKIFRRKICVGKFAVGKIVWENSPSENLPSEKPPDTGKYMSVCPFVSLSACM